MTLSQNQKNRISQAVFLLFLLISSYLAIIAIAKTRQQEQQASIALEQQKLHTYKLRNDAIVASIKESEISRAQLEQIISNSNEQVKEITRQFQRIKSFDKTRTIVKFDTIKVTYQQKIPYNFTRQGFIRDKYYSYKYKSNQDGFQLDSLIAQDTVVRIQGLKRKWLLGKSTHTVDEYHSNPHVSVIGSTHYEIQEKVPWYRSPPLIFALGVVGGALIVR